MSFSISEPAPAEVQRVVRDIEDEINRLRGLTGEKGVFPAEVAEVKAELTRTNASLESTLKQVTAYGSFAP